MIGAPREPRADWLAANEWDARATEHHADYPHLDLAEEFVLSTGVSEHSVLDLI